MNLQIQLFGAYLYIGLHVLFVVVGVILIAFKKVQPGFAFFTTGSVAPIVVFLAVLGLVPNRWMVFFWIFIVLGIIALLQMYLEKKWKPKQEEKTASAPAVSLNIVFRKYFIN